MKFFNMSDFSDLWVTSGGLSIYPTPMNVAEKANAKLEREGKVVGGHETQNEGFRFTEKPGVFGFTHKALLINIEPIEKSQTKFEKFKELYDKGLITDAAIEKALNESSEATQLCKHPAEKVKVKIDMGGTFMYEFQCQCGAKVKPVSFEVCE